MRQLSTDFCNIYRCQNIRKTSMYSQLRSFMKENNIIIDDQSGFRQYHSTETTLLDSTNEWLYNMDQSLINGVLFLDLKKAFDTVNHKILLSKLEVYGIRGHSLDWFRSYFTNRKQVCANNGEPSDEKEIHCGVPQGSNLGPFLFLLYIMICLTALKQLRPDYLLTIQLFQQQDQQWTKLKQN